MSGVNWKDAGGKLVLESFFSTADLSLDLFVAYVGTTQADNNGMLQYELCEGPDDGLYETDLGIVDYVVSLTGGSSGIPQIEWDAIVLEFSGPLENPSGHLTIIGYRVTATSALAPGGVCVLFDELLPDEGHTPSAGSKLTIYPQSLAGNGTPT